MRLEANRPTPNHIFPLESGVGEGEWRGRRRGREGEGKGEGERRGEEGGHAKIPTVQQVAVLMHSHLTVFPA